MRSRAIEAFSTRALPAILRVAGRLVAGGLVAGRLVTGGLVGAGLIAGGLVGCRAGEPAGPALSFTSGRDVWQTSEVRAVVQEIRGVDRVELSLRIEARHPETGENLTFLLLASRLEGSHRVQVFGHLAGFDSGKGYERLVPISSACGGADPSTALNIDAVDAEQRTLDGSFLVNVCGIETDHAWTLGEGRLRSIPF